MRIIVVKKRHLSIAFVCLVFIITTAIISFTTNKSVISSTTVRKLPIYAVNTSEKKIALTFDCAWENSDSQILMSLLDNNNIKATFFATGDWCERYPDDVKLFFSKGHSVENHSYNHPHVASISKEKLIDDTKKCDEVITSLTGKKPTLYRAPYGEYSNNMLSVFEDDLHHKVIQWDVDVSAI